MRRDMHVSYVHTHTHTHTDWVDSGDEQPDVLLSDPDTWFCQGGRERGEGGGVGNPSDIFDAQLDVHFFCFF